MKSRSTCNPPASMCCPEFSRNFGGQARRFSQDPKTELVKAGARILHTCPFCGAGIDPVVTCRFCRARVLLSEAWIDDGRYLCRHCGPKLRAERERISRIGTEG